MLDLPLLVRATWERTLNATITERKKPSPFRQQHPVMFENNFLVMVHVPPFTITDDSGKTGSSNRMRGEEENRRMSQLLQHASVFFFKDLLEFITSFPKC